MTRGTGRLGARTAALSVLAIVLCAAGAATSTIAPGDTAFAPLWSVHFDRVEEEASERYESVLIARRDAFRTSGEWPDGPVYRFVTEENVYIGMRPKRTFSDLDAVGDGRKRVRELLGADRQDEMRRDAHTSLRKHYSELWRFQPELSYMPDPGPAPDQASAADPGDPNLAVPVFLSLRIDRVKPGRGEEYESSVKRMIEALGKAGYPVSSRCWFSTFGDGTFVTIWHATSETQFRDHSPEEALVKSLGGESARAILESRWDSLVQTRALAATPRPDLSEIPSGSPPWPVLLPREASAGAASTEG